MRRNGFPTIAAAGAMAAVLVASSALTAVGYSRQRDQKISISSPSVVRCDRKATITARVLKTKNNKPVWQQRVKWSLVKKRSKRDKLNRSVTITRRDGTTSVKLRFGPKAGLRKVRARAAKETVTVNIRCRGGLKKRATSSSLGFAAHVGSVPLAVAEGRLPGGPLSEAQPIVGWVATEVAGLADRTASTLQAYVAEARPAVGAIDPAPPVAAAPPA